MSVFNTEELKTEINTIANKSQEDMDISPTKSTPRKSILKSPSSTFKQIIDDEENDKFTNADLVLRPHTLDDLIKKESLAEEDELKSSCSFNDLGEDDEIWVVDIPGTIDPLQLKGQILQLGDKSKFKIGEGKYYAVNKDCKTHLTCVFNADKSSHAYKTVNIKPAGSISIRRKLSNISKKKIEYEKSGGVPYPKNIKVRHPFFGVQVDTSSVKAEKNVES